MFGWLKGLLSKRSRALSLYRSGIKRAEKKDFEQAVADYTAAIDAEKTPGDVTAMATYNRALAYSAMGNEEQAAHDLAAVLQLPSLPARIREAAVQRQERIRQREKRTSKSESGDDFS